MIFYCHCLW